MLDFKRKFKDLALSLAQGRKRYGLGLLAALLLVGLVWGATAQASFWTWIYGGLTDIVGLLCQILVSFLGKIILIVIDVLISIARYNGFVDAQPVRDGWIIVRDVCNMFFILLLLIIAFSTVLGIQKYSIRSLFRQVIFAAILINFSKLICALMIDFSQVIMLSFIAGVEQMAAGNFVYLLGINELIQARQIDKNNDPDLTTSVLLSYILAVIYLLIALVVIVAIMVTLVIRAVMLWLLVILSPFAYFLSVVPGGSKSAGRWWSEFTSQLVAGPVLAFFLWLSLSTMGASSTSNNAEFFKKVGMTAPADSTGASKDFTNSGVVLGVTEAGTPAHLLRLSLSLGLLMGGLVMAKGVGGSAGTGAGWAFKKVKSGAGWMKKQAKRPVAWAGEKAKSAAKATLKGTATVTVGALKGLDRAALGGAVAKSASAIKSNVFSKEGWKSHGQSLLRKVGWETNTETNRIRAEAYRNNGKVKVNGISYSQGDDGVFRDDSNRALIRNGKEVKAYGKFGHNFYSGYNSAKGVRESSAKAFSEKEKQINDARKERANNSVGQLLSDYEATPNKRDRVAIAMELAKKAKDLPGHSFDIIQSAKNLLQDTPNLMKEFRDNLLKNQAMMMFNTSNSAERKAMSESFRKGDINLSDQKIDDMSASRLAELIKVSGEGYRPGKLKSELEKIYDKSDEKGVKKVTSSLIDVSRSVYQDAFDKNYDKAVNDKLSPAREDFIRANPGAAKREIDAHLEEYAAANNVREEARKEAKSETDKDANLKQKTTMYKRMAAGLSGDWIKPFSAKVGDKEVFNPKEMEEYASQASVADLSRLDTSVANFDKVLPHIASRMNLEKMKQLFRRNENQDLVDTLAKQMAEMNHPDATKITNISTSSNFNVNVQASDHNKVIEQLLRRNPSIKVDANDKIAIEKIRDFIEGASDATAATVNAQAKKADPSFKEGVGTDKWFFAADKNFMPNPNVANRLLLAIKRMAAELNGQDIKNDPKGSDYYAKQANPGKTGGATPPTT